MTLVFKLPEAFVEKHGDMLRAVDWTKTPRLSLAEALPVWTSPTLPASPSFRRARPRHRHSLGDRRRVIALRNYAVRISGERASAASLALDQCAEAAIAD